MNPATSLMSEPDTDRLIADVRETVRQLAPDLRARALAVDADPLDMADHLESPAFAVLRAASTPAAFRKDEPPPCLGLVTERCLVRAVANLALARYGDAGILSANTGPALAGLAVDALGNPAQQQLFYGALADGRAWSFFAMTEREHGSDAGALQTRIERDPAGGGLRLHGAKRYVANASRGRVGVIFARVGPTPLAIRAVLVEFPAPGYLGRPLEMTGLRGACIGELTLDSVAVPEERMLGTHLPMSRRGIWGAARSFNLMRVQIAAQALGTAFAVHDLVCELRPGWVEREQTTVRLDAVESLLLRCAAELDANPDDSRPPSMAKLHATRIAVESTRWAERALGAGGMLEHPLIEKWARDVCAFEFMDGTSNILRLNLAPDPAPRRRAR